MPRALTWCRVASDDNTFYRTVERFLWGAVPTQFEEIGQATWIVTCVVFMLAARPVVRCCQCSGENGELKILKAFMRLVIAALLLAFHLTGSCQADHPASAASQPTLGAATFTKAVTQDNKATEVLVLEAQLKLMERTDQRLLDTVIWSLTFVGGVVMVLLVMNFYGAHALQQREIKLIEAALREEYSERFAYELTKIRTEVEALFGRFREEIAAQARNEDDMREIQLIERLERGPVQFHPDDFDRATVHLQNALKYNWDVGISVNLVRQMAPNAALVQLATAEQMAREITDPSSRDQLLQSISDAMQYKSVALP